MHQRQKSSCFSVATQIPNLPACVPVCLCVFLTAACIGKSEYQQGPETVPGAKNEAGPPTPGMVKGKPVLRCGSPPVPATDGLLDDFEDGNNQLTNMAGRDGYWWVSVDKAGSKFTTPAQGFEPEDGVAHMVGETVKGTPEDAWGVTFGSNFVSSQGSLYDASMYAGISFRAKASLESTKTVRFGVSDVNTHPDAGICKTCWNHFRKDITLTTEWKEYKVLFSEMKQRDGWGDPRPSSITPDQLMAFNFDFEGGQKFEIWLDDLQFLACR
jgi:hypothetical protein